MKNIFGLAEKALSVTEQRGVMIASNIVNSSTPGFKAKDIDFNKVMKSVKDGSAELRTTSSQHMQTGNNELGAYVQYRVPMQYSIDGNTVDPEIERKNFLDNSMRYQVSLTFVQNKVDEIMKALKSDK